LASLAAQTPVPRPSGAAGLQYPNQAPAEAGTGTISGVISDVGTGQPLSGAIVYLGPPSHGPQGAAVRQVTDSRGRFVFTRLPAFGGYFVQATMFGYFTGRYGRGSSGSLGSRIAIAEGEWFEEANLALTRPAAIGGRVVDERGDPVVDVFVRVLPRELVAGRPQLIAGPTATTDDRGMYRIAGLPPGQYVVQVPIVQSTVPASVFDGDVSDNRVPIPPADPTIDPLAGRGGGHRVVLGRYATPLPPADGRSMAYPLTFFPATASALDAAVIELASGTDRADIDIQLTPVPTYYVSGRVDAPPEALPNLSLRLMPPGAEHLGHGSEAATTVPDADGAFTFLNVPAGSYTLIAQHSIMQYEASYEIGQTRSLPSIPGVRGASQGSGTIMSGPEGLRFATRRVQNDQQWRGQAGVSVNGQDVAGLVVPLQRGAAISGRYVWDDPAAAAGRAYPRIARAEPANGDPSLGMPQSDFTPIANASTTDTFHLEGLLAGRYQVQFIGGGARIKSVVWNGQDYTYRPFDAAGTTEFRDVVVTLTTESIRLTGTVRDARGLVVEEAGVIVFPAEPEQWQDFGFLPARVKAIQTTNDGRYLFQSLPAGDYLAVAVEADLVNAWKDPAFLRRAARVAPRFSLDWGDTTTQDLRLEEIR
jgi:hypothetical protein